MSPMKFSSKKLQLNIENTKEHLKLSEKTKRLYAPLRFFFLYG